MRYAVRNEYAETAVDFIARRSRLAFLNAQASLDALPRVVDIMAEEHGWNTARRREELKRGVDFLQTMGLLGTVELEPTPKTWLEWAQATIFGPKAKSDGRPYTVTRALFEPGEVDSLKNSFLSKVSGTKQGPATGETESQPRLSKEDLLSLLRAIPGFEKVRNSEFSYVLVESGFSQQIEFDFDEFVEVDISYPSFLVAGSTDGFLLSQICAELREVLFSTLPARPAEETERRRIPVEKSGGGV